MRATVYSTSPYPVAEGAQSGADDSRSVTFLLRNDTATNDIILGKSPSEAVADQGFTWAFDDGMLAIDLEPGEVLWARSTGLPQAVHILRQGRIVEEIPPAPSPRARPIVGSVAEELYQALAPIMVDDA